MTAPTVNAYYNAPTNEITWANFDTIAEDFKKRHPRH